MKRHPALVTLSQDHHHALVVAQRLRRAHRGTAADAARAFGEWWEPDARQHFRLEEEILLPALAANGVSPREEAIVQTLVDHMLIRRDAAVIANRAPLDLLHDLGNRLAAHVRLEEQHLFPLIESTLREDQLCMVAQQLSRAHQ